MDILPPPADTQTVFSVDDVVGVLAKVRSVGGDVDGPHPDWARALRDAASIEDELRQGVAADTERIRALADHALGMLSAAHDGESACVSALRLVLGALRRWGRGAFDCAIVGAVQNASDLLHGRTAGGANR